MPLIVDYPQASLTNALALAKAVDELGGTCSLEMAAEKMNKKVGGGFKAVVGAAVKYDLLNSKKGQLATTARFKDFKLAYSSDEAKEVLRGAFLSPPLFLSIFDRFKGRELPLSHFEKLLIKEFNVNDAIASRVSKYFIDGAKQTNLLLGDGRLTLDPDVTAANENGQEPADEVLDRKEPGDGSQVNERNHSMFNSSDAYSVRITGPGMDSQVFITEAEDLDIVAVMLQKIRRRLGGVEKSEA